MASYIPAGRLSAVDYDGQKIAIQTEFSKYPEPRIATSVSLGGSVIHKIQKKWGKQIDSLEEMRVVEEVINKQHNEVTALVHEHAHTLIGHSQSSAGNDSQFQPRGNALLDQISQVEHVETAFILTADGKLVTQQRPTQEAEVIAAMVGQLMEILFEIARTANLGDCDDCVLSLGAHDLLLLPYQGGFIAALTDSRVRKREVLAELWKIARAA